IARPRLGRRIIAPDGAGLPEAYPDDALGVRPDAARPDPWPGRLHHRHGAGRRVDLGDVIAGERCVPDVTRRGGGDAVGAAALRRRPGVDLAGLGIDAAVDAVL